MTLVTRQAMVDDSGDFISGTELDKAAIDQLYDQIDDQAHSTTNPTVKPKAITDEVVTARGTLGTLDARLDVALNDDGTLKTQASLVTGAQAQSLLGGRNVAVNGDLADWAAGGAAAPDGFTLAGAGATIARTGIAMVDTFHFGTGSGFAAKITRAGNDWTLTQDVIAAADFAKFTNVKGQNFSVAVKGKTAIGSYLRLVVDDGVTTTVGAYHTGGGAEEHLSVTHPISNTATKLSVYVEGKGSNGDGYVGGFNFVFADLAPSDWQPLSVIGDANTTSKGLVTTGTQSFAGAKTFTGALGVGGLATFSGRVKVTPYKPLADDFTDHATSGTGATDVWSVSVPGGTLQNGETLHVESYGDLTGDSNAKTFLFTLGASPISLGSSPTGNFISYRMHLTIVRVSASVQRCYFTLFEGLVGIASVYVALTENMDNPLTLTITLTHATSGATTQRTVRTWIEPAV